MSDGLFRIQVSYSQLKPCGYQNLLDRHIWAHERGDHADHNEKLCRLCQGLPPAPKGIRPIFGTAVHAGIEFELVTHQGAEAALAHAERVLEEEIKDESAEGKSGVLWDDPARVRKDGLPYRGDEGKMPTLNEAQRNLGLAVPAWIRNFGDKIEVEGTPEREFRLALGGEYEGCFLKGVLDVPTTEGGLVDIKASGSSKWDRDDKLDGKLIQGHIYNRAYEQLFGRPPNYMVFHVLRTGTHQIQTIEVPYDPAAIERTFEHFVYPRIRAIEQNALIPNVDGYWHDPKWCDHWGVCPLGAAARGGSKRLELEMVA